MDTNLLKSAVADRKLLAFDYSDKPRLVEPHALGINSKDQLILRAFQVSDDGGWKLFNLDNVYSLGIVDGESQAPRPGYKAGDKAMVTILAELPA